MFSARKTGSVSWLPSDRLVPELLDCSLEHVLSPAASHRVCWLLLIGLFSAQAFASEPGFSVFLVRHAEKQVADTRADDPDLTPCGKRRAEHIAAMLELIPVQRIYSSDYRRTRSTAQPMAAFRELELVLYKPGQLAETADLLLSRGEDAVVVGHSNTTGVLAGILAGIPGAAFDEAVYDRLYQVVVTGEQRKLYLYHQGFECGETPPSRN